LLLWWLLAVTFGLAGTGQGAPPERKSSSAQILINTQPAGATIYLDGQASGRSPAKLENLAPGTYHVRIDLDGYRPAELLVNLGFGESYSSGMIELSRAGDAAPPPADVSPPPSRMIATPAPVPLATPVPRLVTTPPPRPPATPAPRRPATPAPSLIPDAPLFPARLEEATAPSAEAEDGAIRDLVSAHLKAISDGDLQAYVGLFAPKADYYDEGVQTPAGIRKSRGKLNERWPVYEISNVREVLVRATGDPAVRRVAFTYDWKVSNPAKGRKGGGTANDIFDVRKIDGQWLIVKARQNVEREKKSQP
jgi:hypothetical protein